MEDSGFSDAESGPPPLTVDDALSILDGLITGNAHLDSEEKFLEEVDSIVRELEECASDDEQAREKLALIYRSRDDLSKIRQAGQ